VFTGANHICIVTADLDRAVRCWWDRYRVGPWQVFTYDRSNMEATIDGEPADFQMRVALAQLGAAFRIEIIQPLDDLSLYAASLSKTGAGTQATLDSAVSALRVAEACVATSETRVARRQGFAPVAGTIQQIYFREGETVAAQRPVLSILPPGNMKIRFFVPESELPKLAIGDEVRVTCDNCAPDLTAKIYFIATPAEYTPPVIYSLDERHRLVYLIRARPLRPDALRVG